jgi:hypothetical protein
VIETDGGKTLLLAEEEFLEVAKKMPPEEFQTVVLDILKHFVAASAATMNLLNENLASEHKKMLEMAEMVNEHERLLEEYRKSWTENFQKQGAKVNEQSKAILALRDLLLPPAVH